MSQPDRKACLRQAPGIERERSRGGKAEIYVQHPGYAMPDDVDGAGNGIRRDRHIVFMLPTIAVWNK
jgi:hypothetical protein